MKDLDGGAPCNVLASQLAAARKRRGFSKSKLAALAQLSVDAIAGLERNGRGHVRHLDAMCTVLECGFATQLPGSSIGAWVRELRLARRLSQRDVVTLSGLTQPTLVALERTRGNITSLCQLLAAYGIEVRLAYRGGGSASHAIAKSTSVDLFEGDCRDHLQRLAQKGRKFQSCVTDPPYGIGAARWDDGIAFDTEFWNLVSAVLLPGSYVMAFAVPRQAHRVATALEKAGFHIRDTLAWLLSTGVPWGSRDVSGAIDDLLGAQRSVIGQQQQLGRRRTAEAPGAPSFCGLKAFSGSLRGEPITDEATVWAGFRTRLKPGREDIILAMKPFSETSAEANVLRWGVGALNIDAVRVPGSPRARREPVDEADWAEGDTAISLGDRVAERAAYWTPSALGRYPSNCLLGQGFDDELWQRHFHVAKPIGKDRWGHPAAKPVSLLKTLLRLCTPPGGTVLDPFAVCASCGEAALAEGFGYVGIELDPVFAATAKARLIGRPGGGAEKRTHPAIDGGGDA